MTSSLLYPPLITSNETTKTSLVRDFARLSNGTVWSVACATSNDHRRGKRGREGRNDTRHQERARTKSRPWCIINVVYCLRKRQRKEERTLGRSTKTMNRPVLFSEVGKEKQTDANAPSQAGTLHSQLELLKCPTCGIIFKSPRAFGSRC